MSRVITVTAQFLVSDKIASSKRAKFTKGIKSIIAKGIVAGDFKHVNSADVEGFKVTQADPYEADFRIAMTFTNDISLDS